MKNFLKVILPAFCFVAAIQTAEAQTCSTTDKDAYKTCVDTSVTTCRDATACNDYEPVLTVEDVEDLAITNCCAKTNKTARRLCLVKEAKKYLPEVASGAQRAFFRAARAAVNNVKNNVCKNSAYSLPSDSALF